MISPRLLHQALNNLQSIMGFIELAEREADADDRRRYFEKAKRQITNTAELLRSKVNKKEKKDT